MDETDKSVAMGFFRIVNYLPINAIFGQFNLFIAEDVHLRSHISVHKHQIILARGEYSSPRIEFLIPIDYIFANLSIRSTIL